MGTVTAARCDGLGPVAVFVCVWAGSSISASRPRHNLDINNFGPADGSTTGLVAALGRRPGGAPPGSVFTGGAGAGRGIITGGRGPTTGGSGTGPFAPGAPVSTRTAGAPAGTFSGVSPVAAAPRGSASG